MDNTSNISITSELNTTPQAVTLRQAFLYWLNLGFISFGGPAGQISIMHHDLVEKKHWISEMRFLHALNYCMVLPGPEAQQLAIYIGWLMHRTWGGIIAGTLFFLPSFFILSKPPPRYPLAFFINLQKCDQFKLIYITN